MFVPMEDGRGWPLATLERSKPRLQSGRARSPKLLLTPWTPERSSILENRFEPTLPPWVPIVSRPDTKTFGWASVMTYCPGRRLVN